MSEITTLTDEEIVVIVRSSNREHYAEIIDRYSKKLLRYAITIVHDETGARHVVQDSFIQAYINLNGFDIEKKFSSWIYRIVHNQAINSVKKYRKETPLPEDFDIAGDENIVQEYEREEDKILIDRCLKSLPLMYAEPLSLYYLDEKTYDEISDILRIPIGTVSIRIYRAKKIMKHLCQKI